MVERGAALRNSSRSFGVAKRAVFMAVGITQSESRKKISIGSAGNSP